MSVRQSSSVYSRTTSGTSITTEEDITPQTSTEDSPPGPITPATPAQIRRWTLLIRSMNDNRRDQSFFDLIPQVDFKQAVDYYLEHTDELPKRESLGQRMAELPAREIKFDGFDEHIFWRKVPKRPTAFELDGGVEGVDPLQTYASVLAKAPKTASEAESKLQI